MSGPNKPGGSPSHVPPPTNVPPQNPAPNSPETQPEKPENKEKNGTDKITEALGGVMFVEQVKDLMLAWGDMWNSIFELGDKISNLQHIQNPAKMASIIREWEKKIKVPKINKDPNHKSNIEDPKNDDDLVTYLYRSLSLKMPELKEIKPPTKEIKLPHLILQLKRANYLYLEGKSAIVEGFRKKPQKLFKGDMVVFRDKFKNEFTAGFVESANDTTIYIRNNESNEPIKKLSNQAFVAFHFPGNKVKGVAPASLWEEEKKKLKNEKKS